MGLLIFHTTHRILARNVEIAWNKPGFCEGFAWNLIFFYFVRGNASEGYKD